jgi:hypothetical protein
VPSIHPSSQPALAIERLDLFGLAIPGTCLVVKPLVVCGSQGYGVDGASVHMSIVALPIKNIQGGFAGAGLVPYNPERVLSKLDVKLRTPTPLNSRAGTPQPWVFQTPHNPREANAQSTLIKTRIANHQNSSPTSMLAAVDQLTKSTTAVMHQVALLRSVTVQDAQDVLDQKAVGGEAVQETQPDGSGAGGARTKVRCCGVCGKPGHNARTCQEAAELSDSAVSDVIIVGS